MHHYINCPGCFENFCTDCDNDVCPECGLNWTDLEAIANPEDSWPDSYSDL